jgi:hypothetical protein
MKIVVLDDSERFASDVWCLSNIARLHMEFPMANAKHSNVSTKESPAFISDSGRVRIGNTSPAFPPVRSSSTNISDSGKMRIGNTSPAFPPMRGRPANISDAEKVRIGNATPAFPPRQSR